MKTNREYSPIRKPFSNIESCDFTCVEVFNDCIANFLYNNEAAKRCYAFFNYVAKAHLHETLAKGEWKNYLFHEKFKSSGENSRLLVSEMKARLFTFF